VLGHAKLGLPPRCWIHAPNSVVLHGCCLLGRGARAISIPDRPRRLCARAPFPGEHNVFVESQAAGGTCLLFIKRCFWRHAGSLTSRFRCGRGGVW
jgi:hypothetical protein